jgi:hypothetical protein
MMYTIEQSCTTEYRNENRWPFSNWTGKGHIVEVEARGTDRDPQLLSCSIIRKEDLHLRYVQYFPTPNEVLSRMGMRMSSLPNAIRVGALWRTYKPRAMAICVAEQLLQREVGNFHMYCNCDLDLTKDDGNEDSCRRDGSDGSDGSDYLPVDTAYIEHIGKTGPKDVGNFGTPLSMEAKGEKYGTLML